MFPLELGPFCLVLSSRSVEKTIVKTYSSSEILPFLSFFIEDCHAINYYVFVAFSCDLDDLSCHCRASESKQREHEAVRLCELTSGIEFHEVYVSLAKMVKHIKY